MKSIQEIPDRGDEETKMARKCHVPQNHSG